MFRRSLSLLAVAALLLVGTAGPARADTAPDTVSTAVQAALANFDGTASVVVIDPINGDVYERDPARVFPAASLYKLMVMVEAYRQAATGEISLDGTTVTVPSAYGGPDNEVAISVRDAVERMITVSDNPAAVALVDLLDPHRVNAAAVALGLTATRINTKLPEDERTADFNTTTAADMARLFAALAKGTVTSSDASAEMLAILRRQRINDRLPTGLPDGTPIAHKTGNLDGDLHDAGLITTPGGYRVVVMLTADPSSPDLVPTLAAAIAQAAYYLPLRELAASVGSMQLSAVAVGRPYTVSAHVGNGSTFDWDGTVTLVARWREPTGALIQTDVGRLPPLRRGESTDLTIAGQVPPFAGAMGVIEVEVLRGTASAGPAHRVLFLINTGR